MKWHVKRGGQEIGEYSEESIREMLSRGDLSPDDMARSNDAGEWTPLGSVFSGAAATQPELTAAPPPLPDNNLVGAILTTLCCCLPFGIVSIVYAAQVKGKYMAGDYAGAERAAGSSRVWMYWGIGLGLVLVVLNIIGALLTEGQSF